MNGRPMAKNAASKQNKSKAKSMIYSMFPTIRGPRRAPLHSIALWLAIKSETLHKHETTAEKNWMNYFLVDRVYVYFY